MSKRLDAMEQMIAKGSRDPFVFYARAMELRSLDRLDDALQAFRDCARDFPDYVPTYLMSGQLAVELGRSDEARDLLSRGIERARANGDAHALSEMATILARVEAA